MSNQVAYKSSLNVVQRIKQGDALAFEEIFTEFYPRLVNFARGILKDDSLAEEQAQEVFVQLWEKRHSLKENIALFPYLLTSVRNRCINIINRRAVQNKYIAQTQRAYQIQILNYDYNDLTEDLIKKLYAALDQLPEKCRQVFELSKFEGLSHKAIEAKLNISTKTVENHITKAIKILKNEMCAKVQFFLFCVGVLLY